MLEAFEKKKKGKKECLSLENILEGILPLLFLNRRRTLEPGSST